MLSKEQILKQIRTLFQGNSPETNSGEAIGACLENILLHHHPYLSLERLRPYLYRVTFDSLPEDSEEESPIIAGGCSAFVQDGKLYRNLDFKYDKTASFIVKTRDFEGMSFLTGLNDGHMDDSKIAQLPYRIVDGVNNHGIKVSTHIIFKDWGWNGSGIKSIPLTRLPYEILKRVKSMSTIEDDLSEVLSNLAYVSSMGDYLLQCLVTDGTSTYVIIPPDNDGESYVIQDATLCPKMTNFRWFASNEVSRTDSEMQERPTGVERFNLMPCALEDLRFTKCYENSDRLSEFIGINGTTKESTDEELKEIYNLAHEKYISRQRDGQTWQTVHSVIYGSKMEALYIQENWSDNCISVSNFAEIIETSKLEISLDKTSAQLKEVYNLCIKNPELCGEVVFYNANDKIRYVTNGWKIGTEVIDFHLLIRGGGGRVISTIVTLSSNGTLSVVEETSYSKAYNHEDYL